MPLNNFGLASPNLYRCAQPDADGIRALSLIGIRIILKLNSEVTDEISWCRQEKIELYLNPIPTFNNSAQDTRIVAARLKSLVDAHVPVAVHCEHGRDRTGLVIGAYRLIYDKVPFSLVQAERAMYGVTGLYTIFDRQITNVLAEIANTPTDSKP